MAERTIYITENDLSRLRNLITDTRRSELRRSEYLDNLENELSRAVIVTSENIPADTITMNSKAVLVDVDTNEEMNVTLVYPTDANIEEGKISILAPIGTAMIGYRAGDMFVWRVPDGERKLKVVRVIYQPEAAGDFDL
ncbi:MAG: nucleoside diphosphate kinase regulator [Bellilinea sp.]